MAYFVTQNNTAYQTSGANRLLILHHLEEQAAVLGIHADRSWIYSVEKFDEYCRQFAWVEQMPEEFFEMVNKYRQTIVAKTRTMSSNAYLADRLSAYYLRDAMTDLLPNLFASYGHVLDTADEDFLKETVFAICTEVFGLEK